MPALSLTAIDRREPESESVCKCAEDDCSASASGRLGNQKRGEDLAVPKWPGHPTVRSEQKVARKCQEILLTHQWVSHHSIAQQVGLSHPTVIAALAACGSGTF